MSQLAIRRLVMKNEHSNLPLSLSQALSTFDLESEMLTCSTTRTELYYHICRLSELKLRHETLSTYFDVNKTPEKNRDARVKKWISQMDKEHFLALSREQLVLDDNAIEFLKQQSCVLKLPEKEMLEFCLSFKSTRTGVAHKRLQEYFSARHLMEVVVIKEGPHFYRRFLQRVVGPHRVQKIIRQAAGGEMSRFQKVLIHMLGLMHFQPEPLPNTVVKEVVSLLVESGVNNRDEWLEIIVATKASPSVLAAIATHFPIGDNPYYAIEVTDGTIQTYLKLLPLLPTSWVEVAVPSCLRRVGPALANHNVVINDSNVDLMQHLPQPTHIAASIKRKITCHDPILSPLGHHKYTNLNLWHEFRHPCTAIPATHNILESSSSW